MFKPDGWNEAKPATGTFSNPPAGGHILKILGAKEVTAKSSGATMLELKLDIAEGDFKDFYAQLSAKIGKNMLLTVNQITTGASLPFFKGLITSVEESNKGFKFDFNENKLIDLFVGGNLREEEYVSKGEKRSSLKVGYLCSVETVRKGLCKVLAKKLIDGGNAATTSGTASTDQGELPF